MPIDELTMVMRIALASVMGLVIGLERERHSRAAGMRTCILVAMAGALLMSLSIYLGQIFSPLQQDSVFRLDPGRLPSYAIAGMGFLGAGAIIQGKRSAIGITTAAAMWTCTGVGLAIGAGLYIPSIAAVVLTIICLTLLRGVEERLTRAQFVTLIVQSSAPDTNKAIHDLVKKYNAKINFTGRDRCLMDDKVTLTYSLAINSGPQWNEFLKHLEKLPNIDRYSWRQSEAP